MPIVIHNRISTAFTFITGRSSWSNIIEVIFFFQETIKNFLHFSAAITINFIFSTLLLKEI